jgi:hypothetical protein
MAVALLIAGVFIAGARAATTTRPASAPTLPPFRPPAGAYLEKTTTSLYELESAYGMLRRWRAGTVKSVGDDGAIVITVEQHGGDDPAEQTIHADRITRIVITTQGEASQLRRGTTYPADSALVQYSLGQVGEVKLGDAVKYAWDEPDRAALLVLNEPANRTKVVTKRVTLPPTPLPALESKPTLPTTASVGAKAAAEATHDAGMLAKLPTGSTTKLHELEAAYRTLKRMRFGTVRAMKDGTITIAVPESQGQKALEQTLRPDDKTVVVIAIPTKPPKNVHLTGVSAIVRLERAKLSQVRAGSHVRFAWDEPDRAAIVEINMPDDVGIVGPPVTLEPTPFPIPAQRAASIQPAEPGRVDPGRSEAP